MTARFRKRKGREMSKGIIVKGEKKTDKKPSKLQEKKQRGTLNKG